jgi:hypothetical protein
MKSRTKLLLIILLTLVAIAGVAMLKPIPQNLSYHLFADQTAILGIPNFLNVVSNFPFLIFGLYGLSLLKKTNARKSIKVMYAILFSGILLTGLGSAYYHYSPNNNSLVYDRIPMTIVFMAFLSVTVAELVDIKLGAFLLLPLLLLGITSVLWWHHSELAGEGDLRFYAFIQFYPMILIPLIILLFPSPGRNRVLRLLGWVFIWYIIAKIAEYFDKEIYSITGFISGHSLKHIAAAIATWYIVKMFAYKYTIHNRLR